MVVARHVLCWDFADICSFPPPFCFGLSTARSQDISPKGDQSPMLAFEVQCDTVPGEVAAICGSDPFSWDAAKAVMLDPQDYPTWRGVVTAPQADVEFKYLIVKRLILAA